MPEPNKYHFKTTPYKHQVEALRKLSKLPHGGGLYMEMGTGKTKVAIDYAGIQEQLGVIDTVVVVAPLSVMGVWDLEITKHAASDTLTWRVINYDKIIREPYQGELVRLCQDRKVLLVFDECHKIKNPTAKRSKVAYLLGRFSQRTLLLTGTPIGKSPLDLFSQFRAVDDTILGSSWGVFKRTYAQWGGFGGYQLVKYMNLKQLTTKVAPYIYQAKKEDCLDLPSRRHEIVPINLRESLRVYDAMAREAVAELDKPGVVVSAPIVLTRLLRLSQITGGYTKDDDGKVRKVGEEKARTLRSLLEDMYEEERTKIVIFCRFLPELKSICYLARDVGYRPIPFYGKTPKDKRDQYIAEFEETDTPTVFVAQTATGSLGISLTAASEAIFYSHSYDYIEFAQACDRLHRIGQKRHVTYYHFLAQDTIDEAVWLALRTKRNIADVVLKHTALLHKSV